LKPLGRLARGVRLARFGLDLLAGVPRRAPFKLTFVVTDECSCRCAVCHLWKSPRPGPRLDEIELLFRANPYLAWINLSGGEVVEREDFAGIVSAAVRHTRVAALDFPTAGQHPERVERGVLAALATGIPRLFVTVSLDGPERIHDALRGTPGAFRQALETLSRLRRIAARDPRLAVHPGLTFSSRNDADPRGLVDELLAAAPAIARSDLHFNLAHHAPHYYRNREGDVPDARRIREFLAAERRQRPARTPFSRLEAAYWRLAEDYLAGSGTPLPCTALAASVYLDPELVVYPCATWDRPLGDLREHGYSLVRALASEAASATRKRAAALDCPNCWTPCEAYPTMLSQPFRTLAATHASRRPRNDVVPRPVGAVEESPGT
jgi:MoaA/NifB/PqqE/SkfB family radical SAM enzyme